MTDKPHQQRMTRLRTEANQLLAAMRAVADNDVDFTNVFNTTIRDDIGWDQMIADLEALAGLARIEEGLP